MKQYIHKQLIVHSHDLPLYCNGNIAYSSNNLVGAHPKVYLPIKEQKILACPYCGIEYILLK